jgi:hypothetical protein
VAIGLTGLAVLLATTLAWTADMGAGLLVAWFFGIAASMGWVMAPATEAVVGAVPAAKSGVASATNTVARMVSGALGVAIVGSLVNSLYEHDLEPSLGGLPGPAREAAGESVGAASAIAQQLPPEPGAALMGAAGDAFVGAMGTGLGVAAGMSLLTAAIVLRALPREGRSRVEHSGRLRSSAS